MCAGSEWVGALPWESTTHCSGTLSWVQGGQDPWWVGHSGGLPLVPGMGVGAQIEGGEQHLSSLGRGASDSFFWIRASFPVILWEDQALLPAAFLPLHAQPSSGWDPCSPMISQGSSHPSLWPGTHQATLLLGMAAWLWPGPSSEALSTVCAAAPAPGGHCAGPDPSTRGSYQLPTAVRTRPPALPALQTRR